MPKLLHVRAPQDKAEKQKVRKLANSRHAPGDWIMRARMIASSWDGRRTKTIAEELGCHPQTVRERIHRFNDEGLDGLGDRPGAGRKRRITETERSVIISLVGTDPPGRLVRGAGGELEATDEDREAHWTLDALTTAARERGIAVGRSQVRRILLVEGVRWRNPHPWGESQDPQFVPKEQESSHFRSYSHSPGLDESRGNSHHHHHGCRHKQRQTSHQHHCSTPSLRERGDQPRRIVQGHQGSKHRVLGA